MPFKHWSIIAAASSDTWSTGVCPNVLKRVCTMASDGGARPGPSMRPGFVTVTWTSGVCCLAKSKISFSVRPYIICQSKNQYTLEKEEIYTHEAIFGQEGKRFSLVALNCHARGIDKAEGFISNSSHARKAAGGIIVADLGDVAKIHLPGFCRLDS